MALRHRALSRFATSDRGRRSQANVYVYSTEDDAATVLGAGYFNGAVSRFGLQPGDQINAIVSVDGTPASLALSVTSVVDGVVSTGATSSAVTPPAGYRFRTINNRIAVMNGKFLIQKAA